MGWVGVTRVRRHHQHYHTRGGGHLYQGRFKNFPVEEEVCFLRLCRYVEANSLRARLVSRAEDWPWDGLYARRQRGKPFTLSAWPVDRPRNWAAEVNEPQLMKSAEIVRQAAR
jgi:putative transposase